MMKTMACVALAATVGCATGVESDEAGKNDEVGCTYATDGCGDVSVDGAFGPVPWKSTFTDLPVAEDVLGGFYELDFGPRTIPDVGGSGWLMQGNNHSDDLGMYLVKRVSLEPGRDYRVTISVQVASNAPDGCVGLGGGPDIQMMLGATNVEPTQVVDELSHLRMTPRDPAAWAAGRTGNGTPCPEDPATVVPYAMIERTNTVVARPDAGGRLWVVIGTESGFEGLTRLYYQGFRIFAEAM